MLVEILVTLILAGLVLLFVDALIQDPQLKKIAHVVVIVFVVLYLVGFLTGQVPYSPLFPLRRCP